MWGNNPKTAVTNIVNLNGNYFYVDSRYTFDAGFETMVFECDKNGNVINWMDLYVKHYKTQEEMNAHHKEIVENLSMYI